MLVEWKRQLLTADLDLRLCRREVDNEHVLRVRTTRVSAVRMTLGLLFCAPAIWLAYVAIANPYALHLAVRIGLACLALAPLLAGLFLGSARIEKQFDRTRTAATVSVSFLGFASRLDRTIPAHGVVTLISEWDEGPYWTFRATADGIEGATFSQCADYSAAAQFGRELADFLGWPFRDLTDPKSRDSASQQAYRNG